MPKNVQSSLNAFFLPRTASKPKKPAEAKENADENAADVEAKRKADEAAAKKELQKKKRRVIDDDDSSEDEEMPDAVNGVTQSDDRKMEAVDSQTKVKVKESTVVASKPSAISKSSVKEAKPVKKPVIALSKPLVADKEESSAALKPSPPSAIFKALQKTKTELKSDTTLLEAVDKDWETDMPYNVLCKAFSKIEAITGRLQIQEIMTDLFRTIMLKSPKDLYPIMYLASNSVAPAYECVELGIGDAILIKAIGEATGTTPKMIKDKYETEGDLGLVAQNCKGKQKTLGGFFTSAVKKKPLSARQVLDVFRAIATTKGSQSQKWKVDSIKKLLVGAMDPLETKYIIRGLQGKLRIGLAQSTVLISLAHALALTVPPSVSTDGLELKKGEYSAWCARMSKSTCSSLLCR